MEHITRLKYLKNVFLLVQIWGFQKLDLSKIV